MPENFRTVIDALDPTFQALIGSTACRYPAFVADIPQRGRVSTCFQKWPFWVREVRIRHHHYVTVRETEQPTGLHPATI